MSTESPATAVATILVSDPTSIELENWGPLPEATGAPMATAGITLWTGENGAEVGLWKCAPGPSRWLQEENEFITVITGRMTVTEDGGESYEVKAGESAFFPKGWSGVWDLHEEILKVFAIF